MLVTFDEKMRPMPVPVRVGAAVDVVGQAGKPKTITGKKNNNYRKIASSNTSRLEAHVGFFRILMKGIFGHVL